MNRTFTAISLFAAACAASTVFAADLVVIDSNVATLPIGSTAPEAQAVVLSSGQSLTLIGADGSTLVVAGPYSGPLGLGASAAPGALSRLAKSRESSTHVVGAIRAPSWDQ
jgi:hypothetical protein